MRASPPAPRTFPHAHAPSPFPRRTFCRTVDGCTRRVKSRLVAGLSQVRHLPFGSSIMSVRVAIAGLGAIGRAVARRLSHGIAGVELACVSARDSGKARAWLDGEGI